MRQVNYVGRRYGRLIVINQIRKQGRSRLICTCDCGRTGEYAAYNLTSGNTQSCGCLRKDVSPEKVSKFVERIRAANLKHGHSVNYQPSKTYASWSDAKTRCYNTANKRYPEYGARGITMCQAWVDSFEAFLADMGERPSGMTLERIDVNRGYEPGNCVWADRAVQAQNRRTTVASWEIVREIRRLHTQGVTIKELASKYSMSRGNVDMIVRGKTWVEK